ncbi:MAG TPA: hypothetical protein VGR78_00300 [Verrucomicrobiae bacterium]|nr:hypothetical protein [Verrucomicrobiae bacterium]
MNPKGIASVLEFKGDPREEYPWCHTQIDLLTGKDNSGGYI